MGCDIHIVLEERNELGKWIGVNQFQRFESDNSWHSWPCQRRNYGLFASIAGVRGDGPEPRGLPDDISETAAYLVYKWAGDGHSHSWLSLREAIPIWEKASHEKHDNPEYYWFGIDFNEEKDAERYRIVFWFDS